MVATPNMIGQPIKRQEDPRLIAGIGKYVDDISLPHMLHAALLRSDRAHAEIKRVDVSKAKQIPGVVAVGIFAHRPADVLLISDDTGVRTMGN